MSADAFFQRLWYARSPNMLVRWLTPVSWLFHGIVAARRGAFKAGLLRAVRVARPVIVVGNLTVGGTGKTPVVVWLDGQLRERGFTPGIVNRGYGGRATLWPQDVSADSDPAVVGDEAVLLAARTQSIVVAGPDRVAAARRAIERGANVIIADDGLQHYRLVRDCELAVIDARRGLGNGRMLPAGPLREPAGRLQQVDAILLKSAGVSATKGLQQNIRVAASPGPHGLPVVAAPRIPFSIRATGLTSLVSGETRPLDAFRGQRVHAVAGIGNPEAFFATLREADMIVVPHALRDHARIRAADLDFGDALPVLMTEKDAVKCREFADERLWSVAADLDVSPIQAAVLLSVVEAALTACETSTANR